MKTKSIEFICAKLSEKLNHDVNISSSQEWMLHFINENTLKPKKIKNIFELNDHELDLELLSLATETCNRFKELDLKLELIFKIIKECVNDFIPVSFSLQNILEIVKQEIDLNKELTTEVLVWKNRLFSLISIMISGLPENKQNFVCAYEFKKFIHDFDSFIEVNRDALSDELKESFDSIYAISLKNKDPYYYIWLPFFGDWIHKNIKRK